VPWPTLHRPCGQVADRIETLLLRPHTAAQPACFLALLESSSLVHSRRRRLVTRGGACCAGSAAGLQALQWPQLAQAAVSPSRHPRPHVAADEHGAYQLFAVLRRTQALDFFCQSRLRPFVPLCPDHKRDAVIVRSASVTRPFACLACNDTALVTTRWTVPKQHPAITTSLRDAAPTPALTWPLSQLPRCHVPACADSQGAAVSRKADGDCVANWLMGRSIGSELTAAQLEVTCAGTRAKAWPRQATITAARSKAAASAPPAPGSTSRDG